jgi:hypothetical protein
MGQPLLFALLSDEYAEAFPIFDLLHNHPYRDVCTGKRHAEESKEPLGMILVAQVDRIGPFGMRLPHR